MPRNKEENRVYMREYYRNHPTCRSEYRKNHRDSEREYRKSHAQKIRTWFNDYKATLSCTRCPESDPICLDFHHLDENDKTEKVGKLVRQMMCKKKILAEIEKCIVLCANCHRKEHGRAA